MEIIGIILGVPAFIVACVKSYQYFSSPFSIELIDGSYDPKADTPTPQPITNNTIVGIRSLFLKVFTVKVKVKWSTNLEHINFRFVRKTGRNWSDLPPDFIRVENLLAPDIQDLLGASYDRYTFVAKEDNFGGFDGYFHPQITLPRRDNLYFVVVYAFPGIKVGTDETIYISLQHRRGGGKRTYIRYRIKFINREE